MTNHNDKIIDIGPRRRYWRYWITLVVVVVVFILALFRIPSVYVESLWFKSLGYDFVYWYTFRLQLILFAIFVPTTFIILRTGFWLVERAFSSYALERRVILVNEQQVYISPGRIVRLVSWIVAFAVSLVFGFGMGEQWQSFMLYLNQAPTNVSDPIFHKPLGFYLFALPIHQLVSWWLIVLAFIILCRTILSTVLTLKNKSSAEAPKESNSRYKAVSFAFTVYMLLFAWRMYLSRFQYLWNDHQIFTGVTYVEANYLLPGLIFVSISLLAAAAIAFFNAITRGKLRPLIVAGILPAIVYVVAVILIPAYVVAFIVKPNELDRETPYIEHNINWTQRAFNLNHIELRDFNVETPTSDFNSEVNRATFDNIRLWDWRALKDTLRQVQQIRAYYDFPDVDVDRYKVGGQMRQMMIAAREIDVNNLPVSSRNWINERLIYTHGYGITMNTSNGFTSEGMPQFMLSNMPIESSVPELNIKRPEIYFGQKTNTDVYVKTKQKEFNYPQGEANNYATYEGEAGIQVGGLWHRWLLAWALDDLAKLPFSDDVTSESHILMRRNINDRVRSLAPFLTYEKDPYIVISDDGHLYWIMDAFTESANYPYSRHYKDLEGKEINYLRNSVKVTINAYDGSVNFYVFDKQDPLITAYRTAFPSLFHDASDMPVDLRMHVRYPETLIKMQGDVYNLYHTKNPKVFFQREDVWSVATQVSSSENKQEVIDPYFVLMQLPGEKIANEFVEILPFTPAGRNNMIGWLAGRSDGEAYGSLLVFKFTSSKLVDGPLQIEARIDQNAQLSSQITLWNQQGSKVVRGHLLVIPTNTGLLYVEPIYLQAEHSPMPALRLVVLATQDSLGYGQNFDEAMANLLKGFGTSVQTTQSKTEQTKQNLAIGTGIRTPLDSPQNIQTLIIRMAGEMADYKRLTAEGKLGEAGQKLESAMHTLEELKKINKK